MQQHDNAIAFMTRCQGGEGDHCSTLDHLGWAGHQMSSSRFFLPSVHRTHLQVQCHGIFGITSDPPGSNERHRRVLQNRNNSKRNLRREWKRGASWKGEKVQKKQECSRVKEGKEWKYRKRMEEYLHCLALSMVISHKNLAWQTRQAGNGQQENMG